MRWVLLVVCLALFGGPVHARDARPRTAYQAMKERWRTPLSGTRWETLAETLVPATDVKLVDPTRKQAQALFDEMVESHIGYAFPDGLCLQRAEVATAALQRAGYRVERVYVERDKIDLSAKTQNTRSGTVAWAYHTAVAVRIDGKLQVMDPSLFDRPVTKARWAHKVRARAGWVKVMPANRPWPGHDLIPPERRVAELADALFLVSGGRRFERMRTDELKMSDRERKALYEDGRALGNRRVR